MKHPHSTIGDSCIHRKFDSLELLKQSNKHDIEGKIVFIVQIPERQKTGKTMVKPKENAPEEPLPHHKKETKVIVIRSTGTDHNRMAHKNNER